MADLYVNIKNVFEVYKTHENCFMIFNRSHNPDVCFMSEKL